MTPTRPIVLLLALASVFSAILMPPEAYPTGLMVVMVSSTFVFLAALTEHKIPSLYLLSAFVIFPALFVHSLWISVDLNRSLEFLAVLWAYYCLLGFFMYGSGESSGIFAASIVALSLIVSVYGLYQYFWGFNQIYNYIAYSNSSEVLKVQALDTISERRVFSTLALPGTLWGFLLVALPIHGILWKRNRLLDGVLLLSAGLLLATGFLTRSFGFVTGLFLLIGSALAIQHRKVLRNRIGLVIVAFLILAVTAGVFYSARRDAIETTNPFILRAKNWVSAWNIFAVNPAGTGLNTYGIVYPQFMLPGANETQYAHNTPLQMMSELGVPLLLAAMGLVVGLSRRRKEEGFSMARPWLLLALVVWLAHNLIDIDIYFPSVGVLGIVLIGVMFARPQIPCATPPKVLVLAFSLMALCALAFSGVVLVSGELEHRSQVEYDNNKPVVALATLESAKKVNPLNSSLYHEYGEISLDLFHKTKERRYLDLATESFQRAIALSPRKVGPHVGLGLCLSSADKMDEALQQVYLAQRLYPSSTYVRAVARLMEERVKRLQAESKS